MNQTPEIQTVTIDRLKWARGGINGSPRLLNKDGNMCCLGFACNQLFRVAPETMFGKCEPSEVLLDKTFLTGPSMFPTVQDELGCSTMCNEAMRVNDSLFLDTRMERDEDAPMTESSREEILTKLFASEGIQLVFEN